MKLLLDWMSAAKGRIQKPENVPSVPVSREVPAGLAGWRIPAVFTVRSHTFARACERRPPLTQLLHDAATQQYF
jgi:hypothetical protein